MKKFKGVEIKQQSTGGMLYVRFRDPRTHPKRQIYTTTETVDMGIAERIAGELSGIIYGPTEHWHKLPSGLHPRTTQIWNPVDTEIDDMTSDQALSIIFKQLKNGLTPENQTQFIQARRIFIDLVNKVTEIPALIQERDKYKHENMLFKAERKRQGLRDIKDGARKLISQAIADYFDSGACGARSSWRDALKGWFKRFGNELGMGENIMDVTPEQVAKHIFGLRRKGKNGKDGKPVGADTKRRIRINLATFLRYSTNGNFDERRLFTLTKSLSVQARLETNTEWVWLEPEQATQVIAAIPEQYFRDAATIQYQLGLRAEELPLLQSSKVDLVKNQIHIARIFDGKQLVRRLKTDNSEEYVQLNKAVMDAIKRRLAENNFLLFPCDLKFIEPRFQEKITEFERKHKLWPVPPIFDGNEDKAEQGGNGYTFTNAFRKILRKAATSVLGNTKPMDSRTFRRTCARELVLKYGCDRAASVLRDDVETIKKHYGNLVASDTSTER